MIGEYRRRRFFFFFSFFLLGSFTFDITFEAGDVSSISRSFHARSRESLRFHRRRGEARKKKLDRLEAISTFPIDRVSSRLWCFFFLSSFFFCFLRRNTSSSPSSKNSGRFDSGLANWKFLGLPRKRFGFRRFRLEIDSVTVIPLAIAFFLPDTIAVTYGAQMWNLLSRKRTTTFGLIVYRYRTIVCLCQRNKLETSNGTYT